MADSEYQRIDVPSDSAPAIVTTRSMRRYVFAGVGIVLVTAAIVAGVTYGTQKNNGHDGGKTVSPVDGPSGDKYLLTTFHGGDGFLNQIYKYVSASGAIQLKGALEDTTKAGTLMELRGMATFNSNLYVVNAHKTDSKILVYHGCPATDSGTYAFRTVMAHGSSDDGKGLIHPYAAALNSKGDVYATCQDTNAVMRFKGCLDAEVENIAKCPGFGSPIAAPAPYSAGTFVQLDVVSIKDGGGIRGIAFDNKDRLFVASEDTDFNGVGMYLLDAHKDPSARPTSFVSTPSPIYLFFAPSDGLLYVGVKGQDGSKSDRVESYRVDDAGNFNLVRTYSYKTLDHPAGMTVSNGILYVVSQNEKRVVSFDTATGAYGGTIVHSADMPDSQNNLPEGLFGLNC